jgi:beta-glucosidase
LPDDLDIISVPIEFIGVNYYTRGVVRSLPLGIPWPSRPAGSVYSPMWEIFPQGLYDLLQQIQETYDHPRLIVTENGVPCNDVIAPDGRVHDTSRIAYLRDHLQQVERAVASGIPVQGYFAWSLLDNFEWALGYRMRFGLVHVDFASLKRTLKDSADWYASVIRLNGLPEITPLAGNSEPGA